MLYEILRLLVDVAGAMLAGSCLMRAWMQAIRVNMANPVGMFVMRLNDWLVRPLRRVVPGYAGVDWASLLAAYLVGLVAVLILSLAAVSISAFNPVLVLGLALVWCLKWAIYLAQALVLITAILSWVNPFAPLLPLLDALTGPVLRPMRRVLPMLGRFDLSPLIFLLLMQIALIVLRGVSLSLLGTF